MDYTIKIGRKHVETALAFGIEPSYAGMIGIRPCISGGITVSAINPSSCLVLRDPFGFIERPATLCIGAMVDVKGVLELKRIHDTEYYCSESSLDNTSDGHAKEIPSFASYRPDLRPVAAPTGMTIANLKGIFEAGEAYGAREVVFQQSVDDADGTVYASFPGHNNIVAVFKSNSVHDRRHRQGSNANWIKE
jgi:hypothetical protein